MLFSNIAICENSNVLSVLLFFKDGMQIIFIIVPIFLILMCAIDLAKIVMTGETKKEVKSIVARMIGCVSLFFIPSIMSLFVDLIGSVAETYTVCLENATVENITFYQSIEEEKKALEQKELAAEKETADKEREALEEVREEKRQENAAKAEEVKKSSSSSSSGTIEGNATSASDVVWDVNDVTKVSHLTSTQLIAILNSKGGNAKNFIPYATDLITAENTYSVNVFFLIGVEALESGWITSSISQKCNNLGGVCASSAHPSNGCASNSNCSFAYFSSVGEFISYHANMLHTNYLTPGGSYYHGTSPSAVVTDYCPGCSSWPTNVTSIANSLYHAVSSVM